MFNPHWYPVIDIYPFDITFSGDVTFTGTVTAQSTTLSEGAVTIDVTDSEALLIRKNGDTGDIFTVNTSSGNITMGSAAIDTGDFTMIKGEQTSDPQVVFALSDDANGNFSITADTGDITLTATDDIFLTATGGALTIDAVNAAADSTVTIQNSNGSYAANLDVEGTVTTESIIVDVAAGTLDFTGATSATITSSGSGLIQFGDDNLQQGSATVDCGTITMIKGAQTSDPQVVLALSADANGHFSITADTGSILLKPSGDTDDYLTIATVSNVVRLYGTGGYLSIGDASNTAFSLDSEDDLLVTGELEVYSNAYLGAIQFADDSGLVTAFDMAVSADPADGTEQGYTFNVDGGAILKVRAEADSAGAVDNRRVEYTGDTGTIKQFVYQNDSLADDGTVSLPDATSGFGHVICNAEYFTFYVQADGTVQIEGASTNTAETDSDTDLCIYDSTNQAIIKNRLGATGEIRIIYWYN